MNAQNIFAQTRQEVFDFINNYKGKMNFTMTGLWRLSLTFKSGTTYADSTHYFDFTF